MASPQARFGKAPSFRRATFLLLLVLAICTAVTISPMFPGSGVSAQNGAGGPVGLRLSSHPTMTAEAGEKSPTPGTKATKGVGEVQTFSKAVQNQFAAIYRDVDSRTPAQQKIDSNLIYASRMAVGRDAVPGIPTLDTGVEVAKDGTVVVDVRAVVNDETLTLVKKNGGEIINSFASGDSIMARMPIANLEALAANSSIRFIGRDLGATTNAVKTAPVVAEAPASVEPTPAGPAGPPTQAEAVKARRAEVRAQLLAKAKAIAAAQDVESNAVPVAGIRAAVSQGDIRHRSRAARATFDIDGTGLKIGVLSDSFNFTGTAPADIPTGDLPGPGNPNGYTTAVQLAGTGEGTSGIDEGRAMLQIVHSVLPGAQLYFATAFGSISSFANNIAALGGLSTFRGGAVTGTVVPGGCDIIIDDVFYFAETGLHDGMQTGVTSPNNMAIVTQAVNDVTAAGKLYFSSAGNSGNVNDNTGGAWEGDFPATGGTVPTPISGGGDALIWNGTDVGNTITAVASSTSNIPVTMQWSDPLGGSSNNYDLFRLNSTLTSITASSVNTQNGTQDPLEAVGQGTTANGSRLVVVRRTGAAQRFISLSTNRGRLQYATSGQTRGHSGAANAFGVAATPVNSVSPTFPAPFGATNVVETFSSDGPRRVFFDAANQPITPGNFLAGTSGGLLRQKPDVTAADGSPTTLPPTSGLNPFFGTSAAAPHAGAIAGLVKAAFIKNGVANPTPAQIRTILQNTALDIEAPGVDRDSGFGIVQAFQAVQATGLTGGAGLDTGTITATEAAGGNNNGFIDPGENGTLNVQLSNVGLADATNVSATLTTTTTGVTIITPTPRSYGTIAQNASATNATPFAFALSPSFPCGSTINFALNVTYDGGVSGASPKTIFFSVPTAHGFSVTTNLDTVAPPTSPFYTAVTNNDQIGRLFGTGTASTCAAPKANPGLSGTQPTLQRRYDAYTFTNGNSSSCVTVSLNFPLSNGANFISSVAYTAFTPATPTTGYVADLGSSFVSSSVALGGSGSYSFTAAANTSYTITVVEASSGAVPATPSDLSIYRLSVSGLSCASVNAPTQTVVNSNVSLGVTGQSVNAPTCGAQGYSNDLVLNATLTNTGTTTLQNLAFQVTELREANGAAPAVPFRLISADGATCTSGGLVGAIQTVSTPTTLLPGQSVNVTFTIAIPSVRRLRFLFNVLGVNTGVGQRQSVEKSAAAPLGFDVAPNAFDNSLAVTKVAPSGNTSGAVNASDRAARKR
jgi:hypothetical protein